MIRRLAALLLLLCAVAPLRAEVRAWLDRSEIALGETVTLNIEVSGASATQPDLGELRRAFDVLGTSNSSQISIINGVHSASTLFAVALRPLEEGVITLPPISVGGERTDPLSLTVRPSPVNSGTGGDLFLEATLSPAEPYVQQQAVYALKLFYAVTVLDGQLDAPQPPGLRVSRLGEDLKYQVERNNRRYMVIERRFAMVAERSGEFALDAPRFVGRGIDRSGLGGMFGGGLQLSAKGEPLRLTVKPRPADGGDPWLPARSLQLVQNFAPLPEEVEVGQPLTLELQLRALGLSPEQLPELVLPALDGASVYPDQEATRDRSNSDGLAGERSRRFAIVPQRPGELEIPALRIAWWNVEADSAEIAELPARRIRVTGAAAGAPAPTAPAAQQVVDADVGREVADDEPAVVERSVWLGPLPWMLLSGVLALGWLYSVARQRRRRALAEQAPAMLVAAPHVVAPPALKHALRDGELAAIAAALRAVAPSGAQGLDAVAAALDDPAQRAAVLQLERALYAAGGDATATLSALRAAFARPPRWTRPPRGAGRDRDVLPPLYR